MKKLLFVIGILMLVILMVAGCGGQSKQGSEKPPEITTPPPAPAAPAYVGSATCQTCHSDVAKGWQTTLHPKMVQDAKANPAAIIGDFSKEGEPLAIAGVTRDDIVYTIGSKWKQRYVVKQDGMLRILPKEWIVKDDKWKDYNPDTWKTTAYEDKCIACHTTGYSAETKKFVETGVGCESCHGPGGKHVETRNKADIVNPKNLSFEKQVEVCGFCHSRGSSKDGKREDYLGYKPGDTLADYANIKTPSPADASDPNAIFYPDGASKKHHQQYQDFLQSKHYASKSVTCSTCHDPHGLNAGKVQLKKSFDELCASCHQGVKFNIDQVMPKRAKSATENDIRSHTFKADQPMGK